MLIPSDITSPFLPFKECKPVRGSIKFFEHKEISLGREPLYTVELICNQSKNESDIKIQKHEQKVNSWFYKTKYEGQISGPGDFHLLLKWLKIIE